MVNQQIGQIGEQGAVDYLISRNYKVIQRNWRYKRFEVDVIAQDENQLVFIEVKTRSSTKYGEPAAFVDSKKQRLLIQAADEYAYLHNFNGEIRFDIISIYISKENQINKIKHIVDAFYTYS